jgi:hypothetical protein
MGRSVKTQMLGAHRGAIEMEQSAALQDTVDDRRSEIVVVEHGSPIVRVLVRGEDDRAHRLMALGHDVVEDVRCVGAIGQVPDLIDDQDVRCDVREERISEVTFARGDREVLDELGRGHEERVEAVLDRAVADGHCDVRLAAA